MSTQGDGMAEVTEGDRTKALLLVGTINHHSNCPFRWDNGDCNCGIAAAQEDVAVALAEEREKAREQGYDDGYTDGHSDGVAEGMGDV